MPYICGTVLCDKGVLVSSLNGKITNVKVTSVSEGNSAEQPQGKLASPRQCPLA